MRSIAIDGPSGAGKSTFSRKLAKITGLPLHHLDKIWFDSAGEHVPREVFDARLASILSGDEWIIDGNYQRTLEVRIKACNTVFLLDMPKDVCLNGIRERSGKKRADMPYIPKENDIEFLTRVENFGKNELPWIYRLLEAYKDKTIVILHSREEIDKYISSL